MNTLLLLYPVILALALPASTPRDLSGLAWLSGCWESRVGDRTTFEMWSPPEGDLMVGAGRTVRGGVATGFEALRLRIGPAGEVVYTAVPSGQSETDFTATLVTGDRLVVENPEHDFPTKLTYHQPSQGRLEVLVQGPDGSGGLSGFAISFTRVACSST